MKKTLTTMALAVLALPALSQSFNYIASPEEGIVPELTTVEVMFDGCTSIDLNDDELVTASLDGVKIEDMTPKVSYDSNILRFVFSKRQVTPGTYKLTIAPLAISGYGEYNEETEEYPYLDLENEITLTYTIEAADPNAPTFTFTANPAAGTVEELSKIVLTFDKFADVDILSDDGITVTYNGTAIEGIKIDDSSTGNDNEITIKLPETKTAPGDYVVTIEAGTLAGYDADYTEYDNTEDLTVAYNIKQAAGALDFTYTVAPAAEGIVSDLAESVITFPELDAVTADKEKVTVNVNGAALAAGAFDITANANALTVKFNPTITEGNVEIVLAAGAVTGTKGASNAANQQSINVKYNVAPAVTYDLTLALSRPTDPNEAGEISAEKQISSFFFVADQAGLVAADATSPNVSIKEVEGEFERTATLKKGYGNDPSKTYFYADFGSQPQFNGEYVVTIDKGAFGDAVWKENPAYGHSNDAIELRFTLIDGTVPMIYDIEPESITPEEGKIAATDLANVTVVFPEGIEPVEGGASATLSANDIFYSQTAAFTKNEDGSFTVSFDVAPIELGRYNLTISAGQFGDTTFLAGERNGHGNAQIIVSYEVDSLNGVSSIATDMEDNDVYDINGVRVSGSVKELPAGVYISNGKKIILK